MTPPKHRLYLPFDAWPKPDRTLWRAVTSTDDPLEDTATCGHWSEATRAMRMRCYGEWLSYLARNHPETLARPCGERVTRERVRGYLDEMSGRPSTLLHPHSYALSPTSTAIHIVSLLVVIRAFEPDSDWRWLSRISRLLQTRAAAELRKPYLGVSASRLFQWALSNLDVVQATDSPQDLASAISFRNYLAIGLLVACPVRRRAFCRLDVNQRVERRASGFLLHFPIDDMKDRKPRTVPLHGRLVGPMDHYLRNYRARLLSGSHSSALWITQSGEPMAEHSIYGMIVRTTEVEFGARLTMHDFRKIAATSIAEYDPAHAGIIREILGHSTMTMADYHYNQAGSLKAIKRYQEVVAGIRKGAADRRGTKRRGSSRSLTTA